MKDWEDIAKVGRKSAEDRPLEIIKIVKKTEVI